MYPSMLLKVADNCEAGDLLQTRADPTGAHEEISGI